MKPLFCLFGLLLLFRAGQAQQLIQGDTVYAGLQVGKSNRADVIRTVGHPSSKEKIWSHYHAHLRSGGAISGKRLAGYRINYRKRSLKFELDEHNQVVYVICLGPKSNAITARGIQPTKNTFQDVMNVYEDIDSTRSDPTKPRISMRSMNPEKTIWHTRVYLAILCSSAMENGGEKRS